MYPDVTMSTERSGTRFGDTSLRLLFVLFTNYLLKHLRCMRLCFADNLKMFSAMSDSSDCLLPQGDLNRLWAWCEDLFLNLSK